MKKLLLTFCILYIAFAVPRQTFAAKLFLNASSTIAKSQDALIEVKIDTQTDTLNAISGELDLPTGFHISKILDGDTAITLWVDRPAADATNKVTFSGLTPGGIVGTRNLFSVVVSPESTGSFSLNLTNGEALKNDGKGTAVKVVSPATQIKVVPASNSTSTVVIEDTTSPESFAPFISRSPDLFNNSYFISFVTQDKGVGIDHYEYATTFFGKPGKDAWRNVESPLVLSTGSLFKKNFIKAVDKLGNEREISVDGPYEKALLWGIIILILLLVCARFILKRFSR